MLLITGHDDLHAVYVHSVLSFQVMGDALLRRGMIIFFTSFAGHIILILWSCDQINTHLCHLLEELMRFCPLRLVHKIIPHVISSS